MNLTNPALEFADTCAKLSVLRKEKGEQVLAELFGVTAWSTDFLDIIAALSRRGDDIVRIIEGMKDDDEGHRNELIAHVRQIQRAVSPAGLQNAWEISVKTYLAPQFVGPIKALSFSIRPYLSYPKLGSEEVAELTAVVEELLGWLREHQLHEQDFIRQALIEGLDQFVLRLDRLEWVGWGYTLESLREVIHAYTVLELGFPDPQESSTAAAMLKMTRLAIRTLLDKTANLKTDVETIGWALAALGGMMTMAEPLLARLTHQPTH